MRLRSSLTKVHLSRQARVAGGFCAALTLTLATLGSAGLAPAAVASTPKHVGPVYPAPGSGKETTSPSTDGAIGLPGGVTFSFSKVKLQKTKELAWGLWYPANPATWSFGLNTAALAYNSTASNLSSGEAVYSGSCEFPSLDGSTPTLDVQLVVQAEGGLTMTAAPVKSLGVKSTVGAVIPISSNAWSVNLTFEVSADGGSTWTPANTYFNNTPHLAGSSTASTVSGAFWYQPL